MNVRSKLVIVCAFISALALLATGKPRIVRAHADAWQATSTVNAPTGRRGHSAVWTGSEMLIWGGESGSGGCSINTGARYHPATDSWTPISLINAPSPRRTHTAIWTGTEMIVWGGETCNSGPTLNDGGRYNPMTDTWTPLSTINAPSGRYVHSAVWTGTEMIVWGGDQVSPDVQSTNTGGRYNPATDSWVPISTVNAPSPRSHPVAFWTGSEMIVWGGSDDCCLPAGEIPSGGRYSPQSNTWIPVAPGNLDAGFKFHAAVWTGNAMIVWGGYAQADVFVNTGQRYEPATDTWTPISTENAPSARGYTTAIWTGNEMFVWGGYDGSLPFLNTGGRYNPSTDTWTPTTQVGAPANRDANTLVWTGSEVILWGGFNFDGAEHFLNTGGQYTSAINSPPTVDAGGPYMVVEGGSVVVEAAGTDPEESSLIYSWDLDNNGSFETLGRSVTFSAAGREAPTMYIIAVKATDKGDLSAMDQATITVIYNFNGFFQPVDNLPTLNVTNPGRPIPVRFSLHGDQGLNIFASGYPKSQVIQCDSAAPVDGIEETVTAGSSSLSYDPSTDKYTYVWKTEKAWTGICRQLVVKLNDNSYYRANFKFR